MTLLSGRFTEYPKLGTFRYKSASGELAEAETIQIDVVQLNGTRFSDMRLGRLPSKHEDESVLGIDVLKRAPFSLEFRDSPLLRLSPERPQEVFRTLGVTRHGLLSIPVKVGGITSDALVDTGASVTAVDKEFIRSHPQLFESRKKSMRGTDGTGHSILVPLFRAKEIRVAHRTFRDIEVVGADLQLLRENIGTQTHVVLGFNIIRRTNWYFDAQTRSWSVR
jgi:hypothetical protein